jgi:hypothetical protein
MDEEEVIEGTQDLVSCFPRPKHVADRSSIGIPMMDEEEAEEDGMVSEEDE